MLFLAIISRCAPSARDFVFTRQKAGPPIRPMRQPAAKYRIFEFNAAVLASTAHQIALPLDATQEC